MFKVPLKPLIILMEITLVETTFKIRNQVMNGLIELFFFFLDGISVKSWGYNKTMIFTDAVSVQFLFCRHKFTWTVFQQSVRNCRPKSSGDFLRVMYLVNYYVRQNSKKTKPNIEVFRKPRKNLIFLYMEVW